MAEKSPIEFDMEMSAATGPPTALNSPSTHKNCDFSHVFHNFYVLKIVLLVLTMHLVSF